MRRLSESSDAPVRIVRIIARLNIGGPAIQAITLTQRLEDHGYETTLVRGREEPDEGNMDHLAEELGVTPVLVPRLRRNPGWWDMPALISLIRVLRRERPRIVHTHAAKGGTLGRVASLIAFPRKRTRPILIHTYHGHSLTGYFAPRTAALYRRIERLLARATDCLVAVSEEVRAELVAMHVAPASKFEVVPLGFDLAPFSVNGSERKRRRNAVRAELGIPPGARVVTLIARLVPIKRVDRFLRIASGLRDLDDVRFLIVGDGELRRQLHQSAEAACLDGRLVWAGFRRDMPALCFASDVIVQTSDNEGTPVALIEAQAAGVPVVSTRVGGVAAAVCAGATGFVVDALDEQRMVELVGRLLEDPDLAGRLGGAGAEHAKQFAIDRLVTRVDALYRRLDHQLRDRRESTTSRRVS